MWLMLDRFCERKPQRRRSIMNKTGSNIETTCPYCVYPLLIVVFLHPLAVFAAVPSDFLDVVTPNGKLRGRETTVLNRKIVSFLGVPFAAPPVGDLRFKPPKPVKSWNGTRNALTLPNACYQEMDNTFPGFWGSEMWNANTPVHEDCLYLNLWAPRNGSNLPVMVWLFGGGFWYGSASLTLYQGQAMAAVGNVVLISINYRVGPFGFLYLDHPDVPGNMGLLDQQMALKWIQKNVVAFGGDSKRVTLFGESAGAASIVAHLISQSSRPLFRRGILESGTLDNSWAMDSPEKALRKSRQLVSSIGCRREEVEEEIACLKSYPTANLSVAEFNVEVGFLEFYLVIVSRDRNFFQDKDAYQALRSVDLDTQKQLIIGLNADEGHFWNTYYLSNYFSSSKTTTPRLSHQDFMNCISTAFDKPVVIQNGIGYTYGQEACSTAVSPNYYSDQVNQMVGDYYFTCDALWLADQFVKINQTSVYIYYFAQRSSTNPWPRWMGVMHGYEIEYVFGIPLLNGTEGGYQKKEIDFSRDVVEYWTSFARDGRPQLSRSTSRSMWRPYNDADRPWFTLNASSSGGPYPNKTAACAMWRSVKDMEYSEYRLLKHSNHNSGGNTMVVLPMAAVLLINFIQIFII